MSIPGSGYVTSGYGVGRIVLSPSGGDDTTQINNALTVIAALAPRGPELLFTPGAYSVTNIAESIQGLVVRGLGSIRTNGPGGESALQGVVITGSAADWVWSHNSSVSGGTGNDYGGAYFEGITFQGTAATSLGGLRLKTGYNVVNRCGAYKCTTGIGFGVIYPGSGAGTDASFNTIRDCCVQDCLTAIKIGVSGQVGGSSCHIYNPNLIQSSLNSMANTGTGIEIWDNASVVIGGKVESFSTGILIKADPGSMVIGTTFEDNTSLDIDLSRDSGTSGTRGLYLVRTSKINFRSHQVQDVWIGGDFNTPTDAGDTTRMYAKGYLRAEHVGSSTPTGEWTGAIKVGNGKIWVNDAGTWKSATVA